VTALRDLGLACDLRRRPWDYPGPRAPSSGLLVGGHFHPVDLDGGRLGAVLRSEGVAPIDRRTPVVAVGSNAAPDVMRRKLHQRGASGVLPFVTARVEGIAIGHSAHVSITGFVAATPYRAAGAVTAVVVSWLDDGQLRCLDATEPNYERRWIAGEVHPLRVEVGGVAPGGYFLYESRWGVVAGAPGARDPLPIRTQQGLLEVLAGADAELARHLGAPVDARVALPRLAADAARRADVHAGLQRRWALAGGLGPGAGDRHRARPVPAPPPDRVVRSPTEWADRQGT
jgi:hypothetical protein